LARETWREEKGDRKRLSKLDTQNVAKKRAARKRPLPEKQANVLANFIIDFPYRFALFFSIFFDFL